jgi:hypothetical protein
MEKKPIHTEPCEAEAGENVVHVNGPDNIEVVLTPKAALETARNLEEAAVESIVEHAKTSAQEPTP